MAKQNVDFNKEYDCPVIFVIGSKEITIPNIVDPFVEGALNHGKQIQYLNYQADLEKLNSGIIVVHDMSLLGENLQTVIFRLEDYAIEQSGRIMILFEDLKKLNDLELETVSDPLIIYVSPANTIHLSYKDQLIPVSELPRILKLAEKAKTSKLFDKLLSKSIVAANEINGGKHA